MNAQYFGFSTFLPHGLLEIWPLFYAVIFECSGAYIIEEEEDLLQLSCGHEVPLSVS